MNSMIKKLLIGLLALIIVSTVIAYGYFRYQIDQMLGGNTTVVDGTQFNYQSGNLAITNVNVLSEDSSFMRRNMTVLINGNEILNVSSGDEIPNSYQIINGEGRYLIPGLIDSHVHIKKSKNDLLLYIANGVTQVGEMTGMPHQFDYQEEIKEGGIGPDIYISSPKVSSLKGWYQTARSIFEKRQQNYTSPEAARKAVRWYADQGYQAVKLSSNMDKGIYYVINDEAQKVGIPVIGHLPVGLTLDDLYQSGQSQLSHIDSIVLVLLNEFGGISAKNSEQFLEHVNAQADSIAKQFKEKNIALSSTVWLHKTLEQQLFELPEFLKTIELEHQNPGWLEGSKLSRGCLPGDNSYEDRHSKTESSKNASIKFRSTYNKAIEIITNALRDNKVTIMAGTDALGACGMIAGFSLHSEIAELNALGFSPAEALQSATAIPAEWMGIKAGIIKEGYEADLLLLDKNPLLDIRNTKAIKAVIANGKYLDRSQLDKMLSEVKGANDQSRNISIDLYLD